MIKNLNINNESLNALRVKVELVFSVIRLASRAILNDFREFAGQVICRVGWEDCFVKNNNEEFNKYLEAFFNNTP